jgi:hypothetical protein
MSPEPDACVKRDVHCLLMLNVDYKFVSLPVPDPEHGFDVQSAPRPPLSEQEDDTMNADTNSLCHGNYFDATRVNKGFIQSMPRID